ncbi:MAG: S-methyl-5-thioribose-1-phosphate isomerase [Zoogloeaceae bacterium]|jgi:methylthioribose-1-phosphate isomerase|nr:S-methyl-5-thioribose-1-phosphate isomerase [Zoogloeaceae bacterium]
MEKTSSSFAARPPRPILHEKHADGHRLWILDQTLLPHASRWRELVCLAAAIRAIREMQVRGAPLIGVTAAYGVALAMTADASDANLTQALAELAATRPTAVNLHWALRRMRARLAAIPPETRGAVAWREAEAIAEEDAAQNRAIGQHGLALLETLPHPATRPLTFMTHCNAGWLATVEQGTALAPIYAAHAKEIDLHVWVSETRPRNQGLLTAWELRQAGIPHTLVADNAAGFLMATGKVDVVMTGADRVAANGDVANKIGTFLKALAARQYAIPFYVAAPSTTLDSDTPSGAEIPIEMRDDEELRWVCGSDEKTGFARLRQLPATEAALNPAFDITPADLVTALITEHGVSRGREN